MPEPSVTILCSTFDDEHKVTCDLPLRHKGPHKAMILFGDVPPLAREVEVALRRRPKNGSAQ